MSPFNLCRVRSLGFQTSVLSFATALAAVFAFPNVLHAQRREVVVQDLLIQDAAVLGLAPGIPAQVVNTKPQLMKQTRGLIQNELSIIGDLCGLDEKQKQLLVDLAESEWKAKTNASIVKRTQEHVYGMIDLDSLAERVVRTWLEAVATADQLNAYDTELVDRMKWRQKALISKVLDTLESKLNLSGVQMDQIEAILNEKWRDRWYRSLEATFDNSSLLPEIRPSWISPVLSDSQRAALVTRDPQSKFGTVPTSQDSPSLALDQRYRVGSVTSSESIEIEPSESGKEMKVEETKIIDEILRNAKEEILRKAIEEVKRGAVDANKP